MPRKPKFKVGQVVSVRGFEFGKVVRISRPKRSRGEIGEVCYFLGTFFSAQAESDLRPLTKRERGL